MQYSSFFPNDNGEGTLLSLFSIAFMKSSFVPNKYVSSEQLASTSAM